MINTFSLYCAWAHKAILFPANFNNNISHIGSFELFISTALDRESTITAVEFAQLRVFSEKNRNYSKNSSKYQKIGFKCRHSNIDCRSIFDEFKYSSFLKQNLKEKMAIKWTPWFNVPTTKRTELLSIGFLIFCFFGLLPIFITFLLYIMVTTLDSNEAEFIWIFIHFTKFPFHFLACSMLETFICKQFACCIWDLCTMTESRVIEAGVVLGNILHIVSSKYNAIFLIIFFNLSGLFFANFFFFDNDLCLSKNCVKKAPSNQHTCVQHLSITNGYL